MGHKNHQSCFLCNCACLIKQYCSTKALEVVNKHKHQVNYGKRMNIITAGTPIIGTYFIKSGVIKVAIPGLNDKAQIIRLARDGNVLNYEGSKDNTYHISAVAIEDTVTCFLDSNTLNKLFIDNPAFILAFVTYYSGEMRKIETLIRVLTQANSAKQRIAETLLMLMEDFGINKKNELNISLYRKEIAELSGVCTEGVIRVFSELEREKIIVRGKRIVIANAKELAGM